jgi:lipoate-protein ligase A
LNVPEQKFAKHNLDSAAQRVVTLKELLGDGLPDLESIEAALVTAFSKHFGISAAPGTITEQEEALAQRYFDDEIGTDEFVAEIDSPGADSRVLSGTYTGAGGTINAFVKLEGPTRQILQRVLLTGDFFVTPPRVVFDLEAHLQGSRVTEVAERVRQFFDATDIGMLSVTADDFLKAIEAAIASAPANG